MIRLERWAFCQREQQALSQIDAWIAPALDSSNESVDPSWSVEDNERMKERVSSIILVVTLSLLGSPAAADQNRIDFFENKTRHT